MTHSFSSSSSSSLSWVYDVFPSFRGLDIRETFLSHFHSTLGRKLILAFKDHKIKKGHSINPELKQAIRDSRIAIVIFSKNYGSSSWCLDELLEILKCKEECSQLAIPIFYGVDISHVREQSGHFGMVFKETCENKTEEVKQMWQKALTNVANMDGYLSCDWDDEAMMIESIANHVLSKLSLTLPEGYNNFVGIENHIAKMSSLLCLESEEVKMVGIWGLKGIGKTIIARALYCRLSRHFQSRVFIDRAFISETTEYFPRANLDDYNMKLHFQTNFLSKILDKKDIKIDHLGAAWERLKSRKVLIVLDDLDNKMVLDALVDRTQWFGYGSRIIIITNDRHLLRLHKIDLIYEVPLPSQNLAFEIFCRSAFDKTSPPPGFKNLASDVAACAYGIPFGLTTLGLDMRGRKKEDWIDMLPRLQRSLNVKLLTSLRVSYDGLERNEDKALFRLIACLFNSTKVNDIKMLLSNHNSDVDTGLDNLLDKSLIRVRCDTLEMQRGVQEMGKEIVRQQSDEPGGRELLVDSKDICNVLKENTFQGTGNILGISLDLDEIDELHVHDRAFKELCNLRFLNIYSSKLGNEVSFHLHGSFDYLPPKLKLLCWDKYPLQSLPSKFHPKNLIKLRMHNSKLEKLWDGIKPLKCLKEVDMEGSRNLREILDFSTTTNLERLCLRDCSSLMELSSSIQNLSKLTDLNMSGCTEFEAFPRDISLEALKSLDLRRCPKLRCFPNISSNLLYLYLDETAIEDIPSNLRLENLISLHMQGIKSEKLWQRGQPLTPLLSMLHLSLATNIKKLYLSGIPTLVELPSSLRNLSKLTDLRIRECKNLETLPTDDINLESLNSLDFSGCSRLRNFHGISTNISSLDLSQTAVKEVSSWIENFSKLRLIKMRECKNLKYVSLNISRLKHLEIVDFSDCQALSQATWSEVAITTDDILDSNLPIPEETTSLLTKNGVPKVEFIFSNCFSLNQEALIQRQEVFKHLIFTGEEVPPYFDHKAPGSSLVIPLLHTHLFQQSLRLRACVVVDSTSTHALSIYLKGFCQFKDRLGFHFEIADQPHCLKLTKATYLIIFDCHFSLKKDNAALTDLNCDYVDIDFRLTRNSLVKIKGCGIQLSEEIPFPR